MSAAWGDLATDQRVRRVVRDADQKLRLAEHAHGRTVALATAALDELRRLAPGSAIHNSFVQEKIMAKGGWTIDRSSSFQPVWDLVFNVDRIFEEVLGEFEAGKLATTKMIEGSKITKHRYFFRPWKTYGRIQVGPRRTKITYASEALASAAKGRALSLARNAKLGEELNILRLLAPIGK